MSIMDLLRDALSVEGTPGIIIDWTVMLVVIVAAVASLPFFANFAVANAQALARRLHRNSKPKRKRRK